MQTALSKLLRKLRGDEPLRDIAKKSGISHTYLSMLEKGVDPRSGKEIKPSVEVLQKLAKTYNYPYEKLLEAAGYIESSSTPQPLPLAQRRIELEEAFQEILQNGEAMFDGLPLKEMDEEIIKDLEIMLAHIIDYLRTKKKIKLQDFPNQGKATRRFLERRSRGELGPHV
ncbi:helix-turn-helix domain-containing protein [Desulfofundulus sp.]|uniref:helix-turn-helix domain-containing protein n=1 Tax=Desulfofundulus sp. TaxID=2282750 RepID=UPI003C774243